MRTRTHAPEHCWKTDPAIERLHARLRFGAAIALMAVIGACLFSGSLSALMAPLVHGMAQVEQQTQHQR